MSFPSLAVVLAVIVAAFRPSAGVEYQVINNAVGTPGGNCFESDIGVDFTKFVLTQASFFVRSNLAMPNGGVRNDVGRITCFIDVTLNDAAITFGNEIHVNGQAITDFRDLRELASPDFCTTRSLTFGSGWGTESRPGSSKVWLDYMRLKAGYPQPNWVFPGQGDRWDQGYDVTARFLDYCSRFDSRFVAKLHAKMKHGYNGGVFQQLLGKPVEQLLEDYKGKLP
ncbi:hypothetical protein KSP40_PGU016876 [Platanthera guangdongensis]|uniref:Uncharacterized protein n=1 Tax=Platanthera guangdongensis TaxID=2320717 RepID=A0ABR2M9M1_9ASPA